MRNFNRETCHALSIDATAEEYEIKLAKSDNEILAEKSIPIIDGNIRAQAFRLADRIQDEAHKWWFFPRKGIIKNCIFQINKRNAYSFTGYMITTSNTQTVLGDIEKLLTYGALTHLLLCLLKQAEDCGLKESFQYRKLKKEYSLIISCGGSSPNRGASKKLVKETNIHIENLYLEMSKILH